MRLRCQMSSDPLYGDPVRFNVPTYMYSNQKILNYKIQDPYLQVVIQNIITKQLHSKIRCSIEFSKPSDDVLMNSTFNGVCATMAFILKQAIFVPALCEVKGNSRWIRVETTMDIFKDILSNLPCIVIEEWLPSL